MFSNKNNTSYIKFLCNKNFTKLIFCKKLEKLKYDKYVKENYKIFFIEDLDDKFALKDLLKSKFEIIIASEVLTEVKKISDFLQIINDISYSNTRVIIFNKSFFYLFISKFLTRKKDFNWLNTNEIKTYMENFNFSFVRKLKMKIIPADNYLMRFINVCLSFIPFFDIFASEELTIFRREEKINSPDILNKGLSICITVKNEKPIIQNLINKIPDIASKQEIIFIEGGSTDGTYEEIKNQIDLNPNKKIRLLKQKTIGQKEAIKTGFDSASYDTIILFEGDGTCDPNDLKYFYNSIAFNKSDYIQGTRLAYPLNQNQMPLINKIGNIFFAIWFSWILGQRTTDVLSGIKAINKKIYEKIKNDWEFFGKDDPFGDFELLFIVTKNCFKISEIPISYYPRPFGKSKTKIIEHGFKLFKIIFKSHINFKNL